MMFPKSSKPSFLTYLFLTSAVAIVLFIIILFFFNDPLKKEGLPPTDQVSPDLDPAIRGSIAIIIDDFGYRNDVISKGFLELDAHLTYAVIPGHEYSQSFSKRAKAKGYEVIIHMPMESHVFSKGEDAFRLNTSMTSQEIEDRTEQAFLQLSEAVGMNNHQGSKATEDKRVMQIVADVLQRHQAYFVDSRTSSATIAKMMMEKSKVPNTRRHVFLDNDFDPGLIYRQLNELMHLAETSEYAIGIGHVKKETLEVLKEEIPKLKAMGFRFKFVSEIIQ